MDSFAKLCFGISISNRKEKGKKIVRWRIFTLKELHSATNNFNYDNKLGEGGFGSVYWGQLWDGSQIAVKRLKVWSTKADMEFSVEVEILGRVSHKNLLSLRGYCAEGQERLIVYDCMPNLSLHSHLHGQRSAEYLLDWDRRMNIIIGSAEGIAYLHHHAVPHIIHRDINTSNVLLDSEFNAQVADFGFAKLIPDGATHVTTRVKGTVGYLAPLVRQRKFDEVADPKLNGNYVEEELKRVAIVALVCTQNQPEKRPNMLEVVDLLKGESKEKLSDLQNEQIFKEEPVADFQDGLSSVDDKSDFI